MELSGYDLINDFGLDSCVSRTLLAVIVSSDVQSYVEELAEKEFREISEAKIIGKLDVLLEEFQNVKTPSKKDYKKAYLAFIKRIIREHHVTKERDDMTLKDFERTPSKEPIEDEVEKIFGQTTQVKLEQKRQKLERRYESAGLSDIEKHALNFITDREQKDKSLEHFTLNGIFQIANRAALKIYFQKNSSKP